MCHDGNDTHCTHPHPHPWKIPLHLFVTINKNLGQVKCLTHFSWSTLKKKNYDFIECQQHRQGKLKFSSFNVVLFTVGSRGSACITAEQSPTCSSSTQCTGSKGACVCMCACEVIQRKKEVTDILLHSHCRVVMPRELMRRPTKRRTRRRTDTPTSFPVSVLSVVQELHMGVCWLTLREHSFLYVCARVCESLSFDSSYIVHVFDWGLMCHLTWFGPPFVCFFFTVFIPILLSLSIYQLHCFELLLY